MEPPRRIRPASSAEYLEVITKAVFESGMSWSVVEGKWDGFREAFSGFDPERVASLTPDDVDALAADPRIIRNRRKIEATIHNAEAVEHLAAEHGGFGGWLASLGDFDAKVDALKREFKFLGEFGAYYVLYVVSEDVPPHEEWLATRGAKSKARPAPTT
jgi:DNA-3-methyladenine glycosylase I